MLYTRSGGTGAQRQRKGDENEGGVNRQRARTSDQPSGGSADIGTRGRGGTEGRTDVGHAGLDGQPAPDGAGEVKVRRVAGDFPHVAAANAVLQRKVSLCPERVGIVVRVHLARVGRSKEGLEGGWITSRVSRCEIPLDTQRIHSRWLSTHPTPG